ncbi:MAG: hypothetical protein ACE5RC_06530, partial [Nitrosopumilus sp.]
EVLAKHLSTRKEGGASDTGIPKMDPILIKDLLKSGAVDEILTRINATAESSDWCVACGASNSDSDWCVACGASGSIAPDVGITNLPDKTIDLLAKDLLAITRGVKT